MSMDMAAPKGTALRADRKTVGQLLNAARKDTDAASVFWLGTCSADSDNCIVVIKGRENCAYIIELLQRQKLLTPGKDVEGSAS